jgi:hypothetical protein
MQFVISHTVLRTQSIITHLSKQLSLKCLPMKIVSFDFSDYEEHCLLGCDAEQCATDVSDKRIVLIFSAEERAIEATQSLKPKAEKARLLLLAASSTDFPLGTEGKSCTFLRSANDIIRYCRASHLGRRYTIVLLCLQSFKTHLWQLVLMASSQPLSS